MSKTITKKTLSAVKCKRCNKEIKSFSPMRKWCVDCRKIVNLEYVKSRKIPRVRVPVQVKRK